ncbi:MAG: preprotein translocase subunit SecE [Elusimicrobiales bacterium]
MDKAAQFLKEAYSELSKATWMPRSQVVQSTIFVFMVVILVALYVSAIDFGLSKLLGVVLGGR